MLTIFIYDHVCVIACLLWLLLFILFHFIFFYLLFSFFFFSTIFIEFFNEFQLFCKYWFLCCASLDLNNCYDYRINNVLNCCSFFFIHSFIFYFIFYIHIEFLYISCYLLSFYFLLYPLVVERFIYLFLKSFSIVSILLIENPLQL